MCANVSVIAHLQKAKRVVSGWRKACGNHVLAEQRQQRRRTAGGSAQVSVKCVREGHLFHPQGLAMDPTAACVSS